MYPRRSRRGRRLHLIRRKNIDRAIRRLGDDIAAAVLHALLTTDRAPYDAPCPGLEALGKRAAERARAT